MRCRSFTALTAQPTTKREYRSRTAARYSLPLPVTSSVVSLAQVWFFAGGWNFRSSTFAAIG